MLYTNDKIMADIKAGYFQTFLNLITHFTWISMNDEEEVDVISRDVIKRRLTLQIYLQRDQRQLLWQLHEFVLNQTQSLSRNNWRVNLLNNTIKFLFCFWTENGQKKVMFCKVILVAIRQSNFNKFKPRTLFLFCFFIIILISFIY